VFPAWHIALTALISGALAAMLTGAGVLGWRGSTLLPWSRQTLGDLVGVGIASGLGVLLWRLGANVPTLNDDPFPGVSPADVLSAPLAYVGAAIYVRLRAAGMSERSERLAIAPAAAALVALVVNVITI
jgi:hypothetical protein